MGDPPTAGGELIMQQDSIKNTLLVTGLLCIVCSVLVSGTAVGLREKQQTNIELDQKKKILEVCGIDFEPSSIDSVFQQNIQTRLVNLQTGEYVESTEIGELNLQQYDLKKVLVSDGSDLTDDPAGLGGRRENYAKVFLYPSQDQIILPIRGRGLWSTLWGYIVLSKDANTTHGITFYQHKETPGLGGEVDNPLWKAQWRGKQAIQDGEIVLQVMRYGKVTDPSRQIDGLAGATITTAGVDRLVRFWLGDQGFGLYLARPDKFTAEPTVQ